MKRSTTRQARAALRSLHATSLIAFLVAGQLLVSGAAAQETPPPGVDTPPAQEAPAPEGKAETAETAAEEGSASEIKELRQMLEAQAEQSKKDAEALKALQAEMQTVKAAQEEAALAEATELERSLEEDAIHQRYLEAWGFFDVTLAKAWASPDTGAIALGTPTEASFVMGGANVYLRSQMTESLSAMLETRLTFLPNGQVNQRASEVWVDGEQVPIDTEYQRTDTTTRGPLSLQEYRLGGLFIERLHLDWTPKDWFNLRLGRFLTDYGIWNVDHGSPTLIAVMPPSLISSQLIPSWQTGALLHGRYPLGGAMVLNASVAVSNGRGPIDAWKDLDDNMAVNGRLQLAYDGRDVDFSIGGYGYHGRYTDRYESIALYTAADGTINTHNTDSVVVNKIITDSYLESMGAVDLRFAWAGLLLQAEGVTRKVSYDEHPVVEGVNTVGLGVPLGQTAYMPNHLGLAFYALAAYTLPIEQFTGGVSFMPYATIDRSLPADKGNPVELWQYRFGLNVKPSPYVTLKAEAAHAAPEKDYLGKSTSAFFQTAVSF